MPWTGGALEIDQVPDADVSKYRLHRNGAFVVEVSPPGGPGPVLFTGLSIPDDGTYLFTATTKDMDGNESAPGPALSVHLDHIAPAIPGAPRQVSSFSWTEV
jgi:hypothetical protein